MGVRCTAVDALGSLTVHAASQASVVSRVTELVRRPGQPPPAHTRSPPSSANARP